MIINAMISRIDVPATPTPGSDAQWTNGSAVSIPCAIDAPRMAQRQTLTGAIQDATAVCYVESAELLAVGISSITVGGRIVAALDDQPAVTYRIVYVDDRVKQSITHYEIFLQAI